MVQTTVYTVYHQYLDADIIIFHSSLLKYAIMIERCKYLLSIVVKHHLSSKFEKELVAEVR